MTQPDTTRSDELDDAPSPVQLVSVQLTEWIGGLSPVADLEICAEDSNQTIIGFTYGGTPISLMINRTQ